MRGDQVRIKLHITKPGETTVKNLWMCLNYDKKPTVEHIVEHIKDMYLTEDKDKFAIKLFLDDYWLPEYENSTILRENDIVKVEMKFKDVEKKVVAEKKVEKNLTKKIQEEEPQKLASEYPVYDHNYYYQAQPVYYLNNADYNMSEYYKSLENNKVNKAEEKKEKKSTESNTSMDSKDNEKKSQKLEKTQAKGKKETQKPKAQSNCYKKFAIGSYVHLLNETEPVKDLEQMSEEQIIDDYYQSIQKQKSSPQQQAKPQLSSKSVDLDKMASDLKTSGQQKWKNSTQKTTTQMAKHIRFPSSSSDSSSSSSEDEKPEPKKTEKKLYEPSKEDQLNAQSINKSTVVQNPKDMDKFNKMYNQQKLNAPKAENFVDEILSESQNVNSPKQTPKSSPRKERRSPSPKIDYEKFESLNGAPRISDKIAFKILEISSNFTPEISGYKLGEVVDFDSKSNEITLKMYSKYNSILKKSSKFSVVLDETDDEMTRLKKLENQPEHEAENEEEDEEEPLKVDWRNLISVKLLPKSPLAN